MNKRLPLFLLFLTVLFAGTMEAQSRRGNVLGTFGNGDGDRFGATVSLSNNGNRIAVMAPDNGRFGTGSPQAEVYELQGSTWVKLGSTFTDYFTSPSETEATITLSGNGNTVATGEASFSTVADIDAGRILNYQFGASDWTRIGDELTGKYADAQLGKKAVLLSNGTQLMTANFGGDAGDPRGAFNLVRLGNGMWDEVGTQPILQSNNEESLSGIALSEQGLIIAVGLDKGDGAPGEVQRFQFSGDWVSLGSVNGATNGDGFGTSIAMGNNGMAFAVGAPNEGNGTVRVYGSNNNQIGSTIVAGPNDEAFGYSVDLSEDGLRVAIGAPANAPTSTGAGNAYVYLLQGGDWTLEYTFNGSVEGEQTGQSVSLSNDGQFLAIGRPGFEAAGQSDAGQVDVFFLDGLISTREENLLHVNAYPNPTNDMLNITGGALTKDNVQVRDGLGRLVTASVESNDRIDVQTLAPGYYFLEVKTDDGIGRISFIKE